MNPTTPATQTTPPTWTTTTDLTHIATQIRTRADYFEATVLPALTTAREDWTAHHPNPATGGRGARPRDVSGGGGGGVRDVRIFVARGRGRPGEAT